jgi:NADH-quinone oxidoreductase subunit L
LRPVQWIDEHIINGFIDFTAWGANAAGESARSWQNGDVRNYAVWFLSGAVGLTLLLLCI